MLIQKEQALNLEHLFRIIKLRNARNQSSEDQQTKIEQILAYLETIYSQTRKLSRKRRLVLADFGAGNCYLSFLVYHYLQNLLERDVEVHCVDINSQLMENAQKLAREMGFAKMYFHPQDIMDFNLPVRVDLSYSLHACDQATDKAIYAGIRSGARSILSVSCCQHSLVKPFRNTVAKGVTRYKAFKNKMIYMVADAMRAHLLEMQGYRVDIVEFVSSRYTDKNVMIRAVKGKTKGKHNLQHDYDVLKKSFNITPSLEKMICVDDKTLHGCVKQTMIPEQPSW